MTSLLQPAPSFCLAGPEGQIEAVINHPQADIEMRDTLAIICHPHPLFGGTFTNKVVTTLARTFTDLGCSAVRFNFRGVGLSEGVFADGVGEQEDLLAVMAWAKVNFPHKKIALAGFSFGAAVSAWIASKVEVVSLVSVAPPVPRFDLLNLPAIHCPWVLVQGDKDEVVSADEVFAWVATREPQPVVIKMAEAGHFFHGQLLALRENITRELVRVF